MGHNVSFASFYIVEVMSNADFASKRIGYLAAAQSFSPTTDVLLLTTNQFKKDLTSGKLQDCSQALTCLGKLVTEELGRDLEKDVSLLLNSPRAYIRKKTLLVLYRLIMVHPDTLPIISARFRDSLTDKDHSVVCAAVTVTCELARASPQSFLSLAPVLYQLLMNKESSNWMLIKIVKLMGVLTPLEPRLGKKLVEPLTALMRSTRAKSLLYECCSTVTVGLIDYPEAVELCAQRLGEFMDDSDQNLKYLGLLSMRRLIQAHPQIAIDHRDNILDCLDDEDIGIRMRALELVSEFITKRTLRDVSRILLRKLKRASAEGFVQADALSRVGNHATAAMTSYSSLSDQESPYRESLANELLRAGDFKRPSNNSNGGYEMLSSGDDFAWYATTILGGLAEIPLLSESIRCRIGEQLLELTSRVEALRSISVNVALSLLQVRSESKRNPGYDSDSGTVSTAPESNPSDSIEKDVMCSSDGNVERERERTFGNRHEIVLSPTLAGSMAWILGEYSELLEDHVSALQTIICFPKKLLDAAGQVRVLTACLKVYVSCPDEVEEVMRNRITAYIDELIESEYAEVQERAWFFKTILDECNKEDRIALACLFEGKLIPVDYRAQSKVPVSADLDLERPLLNTGTESLYHYLLRTIGSVEDSEEVLEEDDDLFCEAVFASGTLSISGGPPTSSHSTGDRGSLLSSLPEVEKKHENPFYLGNTPSSSGSGMNVAGDSIGNQAHGRYNYARGQLSMDPVAVIQEENPLGVEINADTDVPKAREERYVERGLQAAAEGLFDATGKRVNKSGKKKKKKKKQRSKEQKKKTTVVQEPESSLIDFEAGGTEGKDALLSVDDGSAPKHLADSLLM